MAARHIALLKTLPIEIPQSSLKLPSFGTLPSAVRHCRKAVGFHRFWAEWSRSVNPSGKKGVRVQFPLTLLLLESAEPRERDESWKDERVPDTSDLFRASGLPLVL